MIHLNITIAQEASGAVRVTAVTDPKGCTPNEKDMLPAIIAGLAYPNSEIQVALRDLRTQLGIETKRPVEAGRAAFGKRMAEAQNRKDAARGARSARTAK